LNNIKNNYTQITLCDFKDYSSPITYFGKIKYIMCSDNIIRSVKINTPQYSYGQEDDVEIASYRCINYYGSSSIIKFLLTNRYGLPLNYNIIIMDHNNNTYKNTYVNADIFLEMINDGKFYK